MGHDVFENSLGYVANKQVMIGVAIWYEWRGGHV